MGDASRFSEQDARGSAEFVKFEAVGDSCDGIVVGIDNDLTSQTTGKAMSRITVADGEKIRSFLMTAQLKELLAGVTIGDDIAVTYKGTVPIKGKNPMKVFGVFVKSSGK